jgi:hypothetical protein
VADDRVADIPVAAAGRAADIRAGAAVTVIAKPAKGGIEDAIWTETAKSRLNRRRHRHTAVAASAADY